MKTRQIPFDIVVGRTTNRGIGINNGLPWKISKDMKMFKKITSFGN
jgi:dihydrofolate reductase